MRTPLIRTHDSSPFPLLFPPLFPLCLPMSLLSSGYRPGMFPLLARLLIFVGGTFLMPVAATIV